jgi:hypothetical protein
VPARHSLPQLPQWSSLSSAASQPSSASPLQSSKPFMQELIWQRPVVQSITAFASLHGCAHAPQ